MGPNNLQPHDESPYNSRIPNPPPEHEMSFGYSFDPAFAQSLPPPPSVPAPGSAILNEYESDALNLFLGADDYGFNSDIFTSPQNGLFFNQEYQMQPPTMVGTFTSYGQQPGPSIAQVPDGYLANMNGNIGSMQNPTYINPGELAAATFLQNGPNQRPQSIESESPARKHENQMLPVRSHVPSGSGRNLPSTMGQYVKPEHTDAYANNYAQMLFDGHQASPRDRPARQLHATRDLNWGSDETFGTANGFVAPARHRKEIEAMESVQAHTVRGIFHEVPSSAENTRPSSPVVQRQPVNQANKVVDRSHDENSNGKRYHHQAQEEEDDKDDDEEVVKQVKRRKPVKKNESPASPDGKARNRRKSSAAATAKTTRENLSDAQKRQNHIQSEQKRRLLIKEGFEALDNLVPGLKGGGFSKSVALNMSADWLEAQLARNERLKAKLLELQGRM